MLIHNHSSSVRYAKYPLRIAVILFLIANVIYSPRSLAETDKAYQDWTIRCIKENESNEERCYLYQSLSIRDVGRVLHVAVRYLAGRDAPVALFTLPLSISLPPGGSIQVDDNKVMRFRIERCETNGCRAGISLDEAMLEQFRKGLEAKVTFYDGARQPISVPLSLKGFTAGLEALK